MRVEAENSSYDCAGEMERQTAEWALAASGEGVRGNNADDAADSERQRASDACAVKSKSRVTAREAVLAAIAVIAIAAAVVGFALYASALVPDNAAAKVDDFYIDEPDVAAWIGQYRASNSLADDATFATALLSQNLNVSTFRQSAVNQLALAKLISKRADELGIVPTDDQAQQQLEAAKAQFTFNDEGVWADTLELYSLTEEGLLAQYKTNLAQQGVLEADVPKREASDDEVLAYAQRYLAGTTQKHAYRIVFTGDDAEDKAKECYSQIQELAGAGKMTTERFAELAKEYSDEDDVQQTGGSYAWSGGGMNAEVKEIIAEISAGGFSSIENVSEDNAKEIVYCDDQYEFPKAEDFATFPEDVPEALMQEVANASSELIWENDCNTYLASLLANAKITYYPVPDGASYNVDMSLAGEKRSEGAEEGDKDAEQD